MRVPLCVRVRYACVQYPYWAWAWLRTPYRAGCTARIYTWACALHFRVYTCGTVFSLGSGSSVSCMVCVRVCTAVGMCSPSVVPLAVSTCKRTLYITWHGGLGGVRSIHECYLHVSTVRVPLEQLLAWLARAMHLSCSCLYSYCACIIGQCVLCLYSLYSVLAWPARAMYLLARVCPRTMLVPLYSVYCACTPCTVVCHGQHGQCNYSARVCTRTMVVPLHSVYCACTSCTVFWHGQHG